MIPKTLFIHAKEAKKGIKESLDNINYILQSGTEDRICKYGKSHLIYYKSICTNILKGIDRILITKKGKIYD